MEMIASNGFKFLVDEEDVGKVSQYFIRGAKHERGYVRIMAKVGEKQTNISRIIMDAPPDKFVDHINGDPLDNRKANLRLCTNAQNLWNQKTHRNSKSGTIGVYWRKDNSNWAVEIKANGKKYKRSGFKSIEEARACRAKLAAQLHGEFARI